MTIQDHIASLVNRVSEGETFDYEAMLEVAYRRWLRQGDTAIDVGAHVGRHLGPMAEAVGGLGRVIAFEPLPFAYAKLAEQFTTPNIKLINAAVANQPGTASFVHARGTPEESGLRQRIYNCPDLADPAIIDVTVTRLDDHSAEFEALRFLKIDVEGSEIDCLLGGTATLKSFRPVVSVEYGMPTYAAYGHSKDDLFQLAEQQGFRMYDIHAFQIPSLEDWRIACDSIYWDFFMVPIEHQAEFTVRLAKK